MKESAGMIRPTAIEATGHCDAINSLIFQIEKQYPHGDGIRSMFYRVRIALGEVENALRREREEELRRIRK
jgi:hypothetical protein